MSGTARYSKDDRVDKAITWTLTAVAGLAFSFGAYTYRDISAAVKDLNGAVIGLKVEVKQLGKQEQRITRLWAALSDHKSEVGHPVGSAGLRALERRVDALEKKDPGKHVRPYLPAWSHEVAHAITGNPYINHGSVASSTSVTKASP